MNPIDRQPDPCMNCSHRCNISDAKYCNVSIHGEVCPDMQRIYRRSVRWVQKLDQYHRNFVIDLQTWMDRPNGWITKRQAYTVEAIKNEHDHVIQTRNKIVVNNGNIVKCWDKSGRMSIGEVDLVNGIKFHIRIMNSGERGGHTINTKTDRFEVIWKGQP